MLSTLKVNILLLGLPGGIMSLYDAVQKVVGEGVAQMSPLPPLLNPTLGILCKAHLFYSTYKLGSSIQKPRKPLEGNPAVYGAALLFTADYAPLGYALNIALVAKCAQDLLRGYRQISLSTEKLINVIRSRYPVYHSVEWREEKAKRSRFFLPSTYYIRQLQITRLIAKIQQIFAHLRSILWQTFQLSMAMADAYLVLTGDQRARFYSFTELVADWDKYRTELENDKKRLLEDIQSQTNVADRILKEIHAPKSCEAVIGQLQTELKKESESEEGLLNDLREAFFDTVKTFYVPGKITAMRIDFSEGKAAPAALPPGQYPPWGGQKMKKVTTAEQKGLKIQATRS